MLQLIYTSTARRGLEAGDFEELLTKSRERNKAEHLTSLLIYDGRRFLQAIEGDDGKVERCFARIALDPRHSEIEVPFLREVSAKNFGTWDLQFHRIDGGGNASAISLIDRMAQKIVHKPTADFIRAFCRSTANVSREHRSGGRSR